MCRHLAYAGPPASLRSLLIDPPHSLYRQAWAPRLQRHGTVNADGFGVGWYADGDPVPARYRRSAPIWGDLSLPDIARVTRSGAVLAAVRSATQGTALGEAAAAPFGAGPWLFSHNGLLDGWPGAAAAIADRASQAGGRDDGPPTAGSLPGPSSAAALLAGPGGSTSCSPTGTRSRPPPAATRSGTDCRARARARRPPPRSRRSRRTTSPAGPRFPTGTC
jgi:hypothetical protein